MNIEKGATRIVFCFKKIVIKIPNIKEYRLFLNGLLANIEEKLWSPHHKDLAKVKYCDIFGVLLIMEKAEVINNDVDWNEFKLMLTNRYEKDELKEFMLSDCKPSNWGYINEHLVKIDYA